MHLLTVSFLGVWDPVSHNPEVNSSQVIQIKSIRQPSCHILSQLHAAVLNHCSLLLSLSNAKHTASRNLLNADLTAAYIAYRSNNRETKQVVSVNNTSWVEQHLCHGDEFSRPIRSKTSSMRVHEIVLNVVKVYAAVETNAWLFKASCTQIMRLISVWICEISFEIPVNVCLSALPLGE